MSEPDFSEPTGGTYTNESCALAGKSTRIFPKTKSFVSFALLPIVEIKHSSKPVRGGVLSCQSVYICYVTARAVDGWALNVLNGWEGEGGNLQPITLRNNFAVLLFRFTCHACSLLSWMGTPVARCTSCLFQSLGLGGVSIDSNFLRGGNLRTRRRTLHHSITQCSIPP